MADPDKKAGDPPDEQKVITIVEELRLDGHGALPRLKKVPLGPFGGPARVRSVPKPRPLTTDGED